MSVAEQIKKDEGFSAFAYKCPAGKWTIGYGRNIDEDGGHGLRESEAGYMLANDVLACTRDLVKLFGVKPWAKCNQVRQDALVNMRYQLGPYGFRGFKRMIKAIMERNWTNAGYEALASKWAIQSGDRANRIAAELESGVVA